MNVTAPPVPIFEVAEVFVRPVANHPDSRAHQIVEAALPLAECLPAVGDLDRGLVVLQENDLAGVLIGEGQQVDPTVGQGRPDRGAVDDSLQHQHDSHVVPAAGVGAALHFQPLV